MVIIIVIVHMIILSIFSGTLIKNRAGMAYRSRHIQVGGNELSLCFLSWSENSINLISCEIL